MGGCRDNHIRNYLCKFEDREIKNIEVCNSDDIIAIFDIKWVTQRS